MSNPMKPNKNNPLFHNPLPDRHKETSNANEKKSSGGINSLKRLKAMEEESARIAREEHEKQQKRRAVLGDISNQGDTGRSDANQGRGSS